MVTERIRIRGVVQGVGFRPTVWRIATELGLVGSVCNDGEGVLIEAQGQPMDLESFLTRLYDESPPLAQIKSLERTQLANRALMSPFSIVHSLPSSTHTHIAPDAAICAACLAELSDSTSRRYRYPFTNCTHCGPRLSIVTGIPYDRAQTTMNEFELCTDCANEYRNPLDRRFHAQANACKVCGPQVWLETKSGIITNESAIEACATRLKAGEIVVIKGIGGMHLAVDATSEVALIRLRTLKQRPTKPLALMAKDLAQIKRYCEVTEAERLALIASSAPIVLLQRKADCSLSPYLAPEQNLLGFMLPYSPLHVLLMERLDNPIVLTSGNRSGEPQCIDNVESLSQLSMVADAQLLHNRTIANRLDDSVLRCLAGEMCCVRRARGFAPQPMTLPVGFEQSASVLALGAELKNTFCLVQPGQAIVSQHNGDIARYSILQSVQQQLALYQNLYHYEPDAIAVDAHPNYQISQWGRAYAQEHALPLIEVQHHHAHIAACLVENGYPLGASPVLGIVLDGTGYGSDGSLWGGEFLKADYHASERLAYLKPIPLFGGQQAVLQPWRVAFAHLWTAGLWEEVQQQYRQLEIIQLLDTKPLATLMAMAKLGVNIPSCSSAGRLFDAVAALLGVCPEQVSYEGQAAMELEALVDPNWMGDADFIGYPLALNTTTDLQLDPTPLWQALLHDLAKGCSKAEIATRFHKGFALSLMAVARHLAQQWGLETIVLSGGVFQNRYLLEAVYAGLASEFTVLKHQQIPANDGGLSLGQAAIAAAHLLGVKPICV